MSWAASLSPRVLTGALAALCVLATRLAAQPPAMAATVALPVTEVVKVNPMASVDAVGWWCRACGRGGTTRTRGAALADAVVHLAVEHRGVVRVGGG